MTAVGITAFLCLAFWGACFLGTGTDEKNLKSFRSYPEAVQRRVRDTEEYRGRFQEGEKAAFLQSFLLFSAVLFAAGLFVREGDFWRNFLTLSVMGQGLNLFDLCVIDLLWWRNAKRIRFTKIPEKELYRDPQKHLQAFARALVLFAAVALVDGFLLTLF